MDYRVVYTKKAQNDLKKMENEEVKRILTKISNWAKNEEPLKQSKKLNGFEISTYRYRIGDYRVVFRIDPKTHSLVILVVLRILHRKEVYNASW
ncbi:MAG: type II toxin-antitoxin system RelE/ParE family toxin [Candidatus Altimarinota bacterium]